MSVKTHNRQNHLLCANMHMQWEIRWEISKTTGTLSEPIRDIFRVVLFGTLLTRACKKLRIKAIQFLLMEAIMAQVDYQAAIISTATGYSIQTVNPTHMPGK